VLRAASRHLPRWVAALALLLALAVAVPLVVVADWPHASPASVVQDDSPGPARTVPPPPAALVLLALAFVTVTLVLSRRPSPTFASPRLRLRAPPHLVAI
jgi:hypothetical protein